MPNSPEKNLLATLLSKDAIDVIEGMNNDLSSVFSDMPEEIREEFEVRLVLAMAKTLEKTIVVNGG